MIVYTAPSAPAPASPLKITPAMVVAVGKNPFTLSREAYVWPGQQWQWDVSLPPMERAVAEAWVTLQLRCDGPATQFLYGPPQLLSARGIATGTPVIDGAGQIRAKTITTRGWTPSTANILRDGDYIQIGSDETARLHRVLGDVTSDVSGDATLEIWPVPTRDLVDGESIIVDSPKGCWTFSDAWPWNVETLARYGIGFTIYSAV